MTTISLGREFGPARVASPRRAGRPGGAARPASSPVRLTSRGRAVVIGLLLNLLVVGLAAAFLAGGSAPADRPAATATVVVEAGDTLWSIAKRVDPTGDPQRTVAELRELNGLQASTIEVGQQLVLPAR
jgi:nucleoid-associated protein YgaU